MRPLAVLVGMAVLLVALPCQAKRRSLHFFPKDLDMELPGDLEVTALTGWLRTGARDVLVVPDLEIDFGLARRVEIGCDFQAAVDAQTKVWAPTDHLWLSLKHIVADGRTARHALAFGFQHGPRVATMVGTHGAGYQAVGLWSLRAPDWQVVASTGAYLDPRDDALGHRPWALIAGMDVDWDFNDEWTFAPSLSASWTPGGTVQWVVAADLQWQFDNWLLSAGALGGAGDDGKSLGLRLGVAPRWQIRADKPPPVSPSLPYAAAFLRARPVQ